VRDFARVVATRLAVDEAVFYGLLARGWRAIGGFVSILLIARFLSPETQGYYYTFQSLIALQVFVELGLYVVVVNVASHEWAKLNVGTDGAIVGDTAALSRLVSFGRKLSSWYGIATLVFIVLVAPGGALLLGRPGTAQAWLAPWLVCVLMQAALLWTMPFLALLEGCNQVVALQRFQFWQSVLSNLVLWICLASGASLWSVAALLGMQAAAVIYYLGVRRSAFFAPFWRPASGPRLDWKREVWPMQWRLAIQGVVNYFIYSLYTPVIFHYQGSVEAGRFGMTWQAFNILQTIGLTWVQTRVPKFGVMIAQRNFSGLDVLWRHVTFLATGMFALAMVMFLLFVWSLNLFDFGLGQRFLAPQIMLLLLPIGVLATWVQCAAFYWRAHKTEPLGVSATIPGLINGLMVWWWAKSYGTTGALLAYLFMLAVISAPLAAYLQRRVAREYQIHTNER